MKINKARINYNVGGFVIGCDVFDYYYDLLKRAPYIFYEDSYIGSIFDCFPNCIWNGGTVLCQNVFYNAPTIRDYIMHYNNDLNVPLRFTFTNQILEEKHLYDTYANTIAELAHNGKNEICVSSPLLEEYLRKNYPNYKYIKSITATENEKYYADDKYFVTVMKRSMNNNWTYLDSIPEEHRSRIEFLCTDPCPDNCPNIYNHYRSQNRVQLAYGFGIESSRCSMDSVKGNFQIKYSKSLRTSIDREKILKDYLPRGYNIFKLSGRTDEPTIINNLYRFLVKPEYVDDFIVGAIMTAIESKERSNK